MPPVRPSRKRIALSLPVRLLSAIDEEAARIGTARGRLIEYWLLERAQAHAELLRRRRAKGR